MRTQVLSVCILLLSSGGIAQDKQNTAAEPLKPMARIADPAFEVATIKPSDPNHRNNGFHLDGHRVSVENMP